LIGDDTIIIPGHGPLADKKRMIEVRDMLVTARESIVVLIEKGMTLKEIKAANPLAPLDPMWGQGFLRGRAFTNIIYQSETGDWSIPGEIDRWDE